ncbi:tRNA pseudouridine(38-40) synthase TruA [Rhodohalobacter sp. SW132]|uniref:tRNA pseudouridine(38-40) synthase TruA n=1 Tax=Rhodohalobacter sp. SW132 TaxID=2293433 RepID=UPI000E280D99|nr:tRNA pseudouridine(38-40) synthase TruA [Rhodohalobacter sp. SW132]REL33025.1 tRNA pseudouridine(38-40) synthase TruA [Rhodohalobacter sp. SW132]
MQRWKLTFEYDGTKFSGWQKQPRGRTVEQVIEEALSTLFQFDVDIAGQGRTDAGVHAMAQTAHADLPDETERNRFIHAMRGLLPPDVAMTDAVLADPGFHARFHALSRSYLYRIMERKSPLRRHYSWNCGYEIERNVLKKLAGKVLGAHDFRNFCIPPEVENMTTICTVSQSYWFENDGMLCYRVQANRFLRHMVRRLTGAMVREATGKAETGKFEDLLRGEEVRQKAYSAPSHGLCLEYVEYPEKIKL